MLYAQETQYEFLVTAGQTDICISNYFSFFFFCFVVAKDRICETVNIAWCMQLALYVIFILKILYRVHTQEFEYLMFVVLAQEVYFTVCESKSRTTVPHLS